MHHVGRYAQDLLRDADRGRRRQATLPPDVNRDDAVEPAGQLPARLLPGHADAGDPRLAGEAPHGLTVGAQHAIVDAAGANERLGQAPAANHGCFTGQLKTATIEPQVCVRPAPLNSGERPCAN
jgi:hypothetical protein